MVLSNSQTKSQELEANLKQHQQLLKFLQELTLAVGEAETDEAAFEQALTRICRFMDWPLGHAYVWSPPRQALVSSRVWYVETSDSFRNFRTLSEAITFKPHQGTIGHVYSQGVSLSVADVNQSNDFERQESLRNLAIRSYFAFPVHVVEEDVRAVLEFFTTEPVTLESSIHTLLQHIAAQVGQVMRRHETEQRLRLSEHRFRAIFNQTFQMIGLLAPSGALLEVNDTALDFANVKADDVIGRPFWETHWWSHSPKAQAALKTAVARAAQGELVRYETAVLGQDGQTVPIDFSLKPVRNESGQIIWLLPEGRDISDQKKAMARLKFNEALLAEAQEIAHIGHWEWDIDTNKLIWSPELYRIYGFAEDDLEVTYEMYLAHIHPDDLEHAQRQISGAVEDGRSFAYFHRIIRPDGVERIIQARGRPVRDKSGHIVKLRGTAQDMTQQKQTELKLSQSVHRLNALTEVGQAVAATLELDVVYERVLSALCSLLNSEAAFLLLHDEGELEFIAQKKGETANMRGQRIPASSGVAGHVWQTGEPVLLQGEECLHRLSPKLVETSGYRPQTILAAPVRWQEEALGVLEATHSNATAFQESDIRLMEAVATWTAIAIGNASQYKQLQRRLRESEAITQISRALTETLQMDELLQLIVEAAQRIVPYADWAAIHLLQGSPKRLRLAANAGLDEDADDYSLDLGEGIAGQVLVEGGVINVTDVQTDPRRLQIDQSINARSLLVAPVESRQQRIGTISIQAAESSIFSAEDESLLTILGVQAGMAIENARLFAGQRRARELAERQRERMRHLARRVVRAQEAERDRIARELHDEAGQTLTVLKINLELVRNQIPDRLDSTKEELARIVTLVDNTMSNLRLLSHNLRPPGLDTYGLHAALEGLCQDFEDHTALKITYEGSNSLELPSITALSLYRFVQEALTNIMKHAGAEQVQVELAHNEDCVWLNVIDDGDGFDVPDLESGPVQGGVGLMGMVERLEMINGRLEIHSSPGEGSRLTAVVPKKEPS